MPLNDYEFSYRGLTFGGATNYEIVEESGILDLASRSSDRPFPRKPGALSGRHLPDAKMIEFVIEVTGPMASSDLADRIETVMSTFNAFQYPDPDEDNDKLVFKYAGFAEQFIRCRPVRRELVGGRRFITELGARQIAVQLSAYDPRRYSTTETDSGVETSTFVVANAGDVTTYPRIVFTTSAGGHARLTNTTTGDVVYIVGAGASATVTARMDRVSRGDIAGLLIHEGASTDIYTKWVLPRALFGLVPGNNNLDLDIGAGVRVYHYDAWS